MTPTVNALLTNNDRPTLTGTYEFGTNLTVEVDGITYALGSSTELTDPSSDGNWELDLSGLSTGLMEGSFEVTVTSTDGAGNDAIDATSNEVEIDLTDPATPTVNSLLTNDTRPTITGTYETGTTFSVTLDGITHTLGVSIALTDPASDGNWQLDLSGLSIGLGEDIYDVVATATDGAGNSATDATTNELEVDLTAPGTPAVNNLLTNNVRPTLTGLYEAGTGLTVSVNGNTYTLGVSPELTDPASDGNWELDLSSLATGLIEGLYEVVVISTDAAGNSAMDPGTNELEIDLTPPTTPTVNSLLTNSSLPTITGTYELGTELEVTVNAITYVLGASPELTDPANDGNWALSLSLSLAEDTYDVEAISTDAAGNMASDVTTDELEIDQTPPARPTVTTLLTNNIRPTLSGTYELGAALTVNVDGVTYTLGTSTELTDPLNNGNWELDLSGLGSGLVEAVYDVTATSADAAANPISDDTVNELTIDLTDPVIPTVDNLLTNNVRPTLSGTYESGTALIVTVDGTVYTLGTSPELTDPANNGNWSLDLSGLTTGLAEDIYEVTVTSTEASGNSASDGTTNELEIDLTAPLVTMSSLTTQSGSPELSGTVDDNDAAISLEVGGGSYPVTNDGSGNWVLPAGTITPDLVADVYDVTVSATDLAGNTGTDATVDELIVVGAPQATAASSVEPFAFTANWAASPGISTYALEVSGNDTFTDLLPAYANIAVSGTAQLVTGLEYGTDYFYRVRAILAVGDTTGYSNVISVQTSVSDGTLADTEALENLYAALGGDSWLNNSNWLVDGQRIENWFGVTVENGRVVAINLPDNNLSGDLPTFTGDAFSQLTSLVINGNQITGLSDLTGLSALTELQVQNNLLDFSTLVGNVNITGIVYAPQTDVLEEQDLFINEGEDAVIDRSTGNDGDSYQWFKDGEPIPDESNGTLVLTAVSFDDEGTYNATITNAAAPLLTLTSRNVNLKVSSLERDELALRNVYTQMNGDNWTKDGTGYNWLTDDILSWRGLTFDGSRVTGIDLSGSQIAGSLPADILDVLNLTSLDLSDNQVEDIPDLTSLDQLANLNLDDNLLQFDDLLPNVGITGISYLDQQLNDIATADTLSRGSDFDVSVLVGGEGNVYDWRLDGVSVGAPSDPTISLTDLRRSNTGVYTVVVSNAGVPGLTFTSADRTVLAKAFISGTVSISDTEAFSDGIVKFLQVREMAYDTIPQDIPIASDGSYSFETVLDDYLIIATSNDLESFLPTYHAGTIQWDEALVVILNDDTDGIDITMVPTPVEGIVGDGNATGLIETDFDEDEGGRIEARRKARRVGVALRRRRSNGRTQNDDFDLFAYTQTNDEGEFSFPELPAGVYRIFIEYPGIPIREDAFTEFEITEDGKNNDVGITATVFEDGIEIFGTITGTLKDLIDDLVIYPNPSSGGDVFVRIESSRSFEVMFEVVDLRGRTVLSEMLNNANIGEGTRRFDVSDMPVGMYLVRVFAPSRQDELLYSGKLLIHSR